MTAESMNPNAEATRAIAASLAPPRMESNLLPSASNKHDQPLHPDDEIVQTKGKTKDSLGSSPMEPNLHDQPVHAEDAVSQTGSTAGSSTDQSLVDSNPSLSSGISSQSTQMEESTDQINIATMSVSESFLVGSGASLPLASSGQPASSVSMVAPTGSTPQTTTASNQSTAPAGPSNQAPAWFDHTVLTLDDKAAPVQQSADCFARANLMGPFPASGDRSLWLPYVTALGLVQNQFPKIQVRGKNPQTGKAKDGKPDWNFALYTVLAVAPGGKMQLNALYNICLAWAPKLAGKNETCRHSLATKKEFFSWSEKGTGGWWRLTNAGEVQPSKGSAKRPVSTGDNEVETENSPPKKMTRRSTNSNQEEQAGDKIEDSLPEQSSNPADQIPRFTAVNADPAYPTNTIQRMRPLRSAAAKVRNYFGDDKDSYPQQRPQDVATYNPWLAPPTEQPASLAHVDDGTAPETCYTITDQESLDAAINNTPIWKSQWKEPSVVRTTFATDL